MVLLAPLVLEKGLKLDWEGGREEGRQAGCVGEREGGREGGGVVDG